MTLPGEDATQRQDVQRVTAEVSNRLGELGVWLSGDEKPEDLALVLEAIERFELAVQTHGGDLMVDEGPDGNTTQPDHARFALPKRNADESVDQYLERLEHARAQIISDPPIT